MKYGLFAPHSFSSIDIEIRKSTEKCLKSSISFDIVGLHFLPPRQDKKSSTGMEIQEREYNNVACAFDLRWK